MQPARIRFLFLNIGHFLDHLVVLVFATAAALRQVTEWGISYASLIPYATPGFVAFGVCAIPAGWLADKWSREGMMVVFFFGIGASCLLASMADSPVEIALCLTAIGVFAAIYHPVGLAMVVQDREKTGVALAVNGIFGNLGVASAALITGFLIDAASWRVAFVAPGLVSIAVGCVYFFFIRANPLTSKSSETKKTATTRPIERQILFRTFGVIFFTTAIGGLIFQSTSFALPKVFDERLTDLASSASMVGVYVFLVFSLAAFAQLVVGYLVDRYSVRIVFAVVAIFQAVFFALMIQLSGVLALVVAIGFMLVVFGQIPINDVLVGRMARSEWRSRAYALRYIVTFSVMASAIPLIGWVHGGWGFSVLFAILAAAAALIFIAVLFLPNAADGLAQPAS